MRFDAISLPSSCANKGLWGRGAVRCEMTLSNTMLGGCVSISVGGNGRQIGLANLSISACLHCSPTTAPYQPGSPSSSPLTLSPTPAVCNLSAGWRYVRISNDGPTHYTQCRSTWAVNEVRVYSLSGAQLPLSLGCTSSESISRPGTNAIDGSSRTQWAGDPAISENHIGSNCNTDVTGRQWIAIDLGRPQRIGRLSIEQDVNEIGDQRVSRMRVECGSSDSAPCRCCMPSNSTCKQHGGCGSWTAPFTVLIGHGDTSYPPHTAAPICADKSGQCVSMRYLCSDSRLDYRFRIAAMCPRTCGKCLTTVPTSSPTSPTSSC
eukprot:gene19367-biopygen24190